jgi:hypothetical protein
MLWTALYADRKIVAGDPLSTSQIAWIELRRGLFGCEEQKGGKRSGVIPYGDPNIPVSI